jgi:thiol-disulfide isomerase/thioredoxin
MIGSTLLRVLIVAAVFSAAAAVWLFLRARIGRSGKLASTELAGYRLGRAALVYFSSPACAPCRLIQRPIVERLRSTMGERLQVVEVDALEKADVAERWGVFTVPTTIVLDSRGRPRSVNPGIASAEKLRAQLETVA